MPASPPRAAAPGTRAARDAGFSLVEIMVGFLVLAVIAVAGTSLLVDSLRTSGSDRQRVRAANVAAEEIDLVRAKYQINAGTALAELVSTPTVDRDIDGVDYEVTREIDPGTGRTVTVTVEWDDMRGVAPVVNTAVLAPLGRNLGGSSVVPTLTPIPTAGPVSALLPAPSPLTVADSVICGSELTTSLLPAELTDLLCLLQPPAPTPTPTPTIPACPSDTALTTLTVTQKTGFVTLPMVTGTVTATRTANGACQPATAVPVQIAAGTGLVALPFGTWTFSATSPSGLTSATGSGWPTYTINSLLAVGVTVNAK